MSPSALTMLRRNIASLLTDRKESQTTLAFALGKDKSWINKFLNGTREIQLKDLDRIADFFGLATYQLFQPGISPLTERRVRKDRRTGRDRRIGHAQRMVVSLGQEIDRARAPIAETADEDLRIVERLRTLTPAQRADVMLVLGVPTAAAAKAAPPAKKRPPRSA